MSDIPIMPIIPRMPMLPDGNHAKWMYERLVKQIVEFENDLSADEELGGRFVNAPREGVIHVEDIGFWGPDMLIFYCRDADGRSMQLLQHYSQLSILLSPVPKAKDEARRIGFILEEKLKS